MTLFGRLVLGLLGFFSVLSMPAMALEEPKYDVIDVYDGFEVRRYAPYIVAEVDVTGDFEESGGKAFKILAGYIFGDNRAAEKMEMTAPVEARPAGGERMGMTAPVWSGGGSSGETTYAFVMERKYTLDTLPQPIDSRIRIRELPARYVAVRRYSGRWTESAYAKHLASLGNSLERSGLVAVGEPTLARYNSPFSLPFLRRNEVMLEIAEPR